MKNSLSSSLLGDYYTDEENIVTEYTGCTKVSWTMWNRTVCCWNRTHTATPAIHGLTAKSNFMILVLALTLKLCEKNWDGMTQPLLFTTAKPITGDVNLESFTRSRVLSCLLFLLFTWPFSASSISMYSYFSC